MLKKLMPREKGFFTFFQEVAEKVLHAAELFKTMLSDLNAPAKTAQLIAEAEIEGDNLTRGTFDLLHRTFITPFDRYDIHKLTSNLDDVLDLLNSTSQKIMLYHIKSLPKEIHHLADLVLKVAHMLISSISELDSLKNSEQILEHCREIIKSENEAERLVMTGVAKLYEEEDDLKNLLKTKEIYDSVKKIVDKCQNIANIIKGIVLEYA